jgi:ABC-type uncharacterized transport system substrate-binding protein
MLLSVMIDTLAEAGLTRPDNRKLMPKQSHVTTISMAVIVHGATISVTMTAITSPTNSQAPKSGPVL